MSNFKSFKRSCEITAVNLNSRDTISDEVTWSLTVSLYYVLLSWFLALSQTVLKIALFSLRTVC